MSTQKIEDQIQFDIEYDSNQQPYIKPSKDREKKLGDAVVDTIFQSVTNSYQEIMKEVLKHQSKAVKVINSIKLTAIFCTTDYAKYLYEEKKKYGDAGIKDETIALAQTIVGCTLSNGAGAVGLAKGKSLKVAIGASTAVSVAYDNYDIFDKPLKDHIGSLTAFLVGKKHDYKKAVEADSEGIRARQEIKAGNTAQIKLFAEKVSIPNLIQDNPNFVNNEDELSEFTRIISILDRNVAKKITNELLSKNTAGGSCEVEVETGGSCRAENLDDIQGKGTYFNPNRLHELYRTLDKKGIILDVPIKPSAISVKAYTIEKGDTIWSIAKKHGTTVNELISVTGNEYLQGNRYVDHKGRDIIRISPGQKVSIPENNFHYQSQPLSLDWKIDYNLPKEYYKAYMPLLNLNSLRGEVKNFLYTSKNTHIDFVNDISFHYKNWNTKLTEMGASEKEVKDNMRALYQLEFIDKSQAYSDLIRSPWVSYQSHDLDRTLEFLHKQLKEVKSKLGDVKYPSRSYNGFNQYFRDERDLTKYYTYDYAIKTYGHDGIKDKKILDPPGKIGGFFGGALGSLFTIAIHIAFPIGIDLEGDGLCLIGLDYTTALYDMDSDGVRDKIGWVCEDDALLVFDINNDNEIIEPKEINFKIWSDKASSDLDGLKLVFDTNKDGKIDEVDQNFHLFKIWQDKNQNGMSEIGELSILKEAGISSIMLYESVSKITKWHLGVETDDIRTIEAVKINWINNKGGAAYDLGFPYKPVPPQIEQYSIDFEELNIESNTGEILKIFLQEGVETNVIDLSNNNYKIFIGDHFNNSVITGNQGVIVDVGIGNNMVLGGAGNDWIKGEGYIDAGDGNDLVFMNKNGDINGGKGFDTLFIPPSIDGYNYSFHNTTNFESLISLDCKEEYDFSSYSSSIIFEFICFNGNDQMSLKSTNNSKGDIIRITSGANDIKLYCKKDDEVYLNSLIGLYSLNKYLNPAEGNIIVFGAKKLIIKSEEKESNINPVNVTNVIVSGNHIKLKNHDGKQAPNFILSDTRILELEKLSDTIFFLSNGSTLKMEGCEENKTGKCTYLIDHNTRDLVIEQNSIAKYVHNHGRYYGDFSIGYLFLHSNIKLEELYFDGTPMDLSLKRHTKDGDINVINIKFRDEKIYSKICNPADIDAYNQLTAAPAIGKVRAYINIDKPNELRHISLLGKGCVEYDGHWQKVEFINGLTKWQDNVGHGITALAAGGSDKMTGTNFADYINGGSGCDKIHGRGGNDIILGGKGDDHLEGGAGDDTYIYFWGDGNDVIKDFEEYIHNDRTVKYRNGGDDTILFGYGIKPEHIKIKLAPVKRDKWDPFCSKECSQKGNIIITIEDEMRYLHGNQDHTDGKIEIRNSDCCGMIEHVEFMDGWPTMHL